MGDMGDIFNEMRANTKAHHAKMLAAANTEGWVKHTEWHYSKTASGHRMDWWPGSGKAQLDGRMIYGHHKVNAAIKRFIKFFGEPHDQD